MSNFKKKTINGVLWNLTERLGNQVIRFSLGIILARLLLPSDYGIIALTTVVIAFSEIMIDGGLMMILIQRSNNTDQEYSTVFWSKLFSALLIFLLIFFSAKYIAQFYEVPILEKVLRLIALVLIINSLSSVHKIRLTNKLDFKGQAKIILLSTLIGGATGIIMALLGFGVWALVFQTLTINLIQAILFWCYTKWVPSINYSFEFIKSIYKNGLNFLSANILLILYNNLYITVIGKMYNPTTLGLYTRARQFEQLPENTTNSVIVKVLFPILTGNKNDKMALKKNTLEVLSWLSFIITPIMLLLIINSKQIIEFFLTEKWLGAKDFLVILAVAGIFIPINNTLLNIFNVLGKPLISTKIYIFKILFSALLIFVVWKDGAIWTASIIIIENIIVLFILGLITKNLIGLKIKTIIESIRFVFLVNGISFLIVYYISNYLTFIELSNLLHMIITFVSYCVLTYLLGSFFKLPQISELNNQLKKRL